MADTTPSGDPRIPAANVKAQADISPDQQSAATATGAAMAAADAPMSPGGRYRWTICALLFFATTINYLDRMVFSLLGPGLKKEFGWTDTQFGDINAAFQFAYAIGLLVVGRLMDHIGTRVGLSLAVVLWSVAAMGHAWARSVTGFVVARASLGLAEAANFPAAVKTVAEWFPKRERALATGIFNAGSNVGATIAPIVVPWIALTYSWKWAFIATGAVGFIWLFFWLAAYRKPEDHPKLSKAELAYIRQDPAESTAKIPWLRLAPLRQTWAFAVGKFMTDPIWWFYLTWLPLYLQNQYGMDIKKFGPPLVVIYIMADFGSVGGGWLSSRFIKNGWTVNRARKTAMLICALCVVPVIFASQAANVWVAVLFIGLAAAAHQGWSANIFTLVSDTFPKRAIGSVVGIGGLMGSLGGSLFQMAVGRIVQATQNYHIPFIMAGSAYLLALLIIHILVPRLDPAKVDDHVAA